MSWWRPPQFDVGGLIVKVVEITGFCYLSSIVVISPRNHYSAGFLHRVSDWDFDEAEDIPLSGPVRDRHNIDLTLHRE